MKLTREQVSALSKTELNRALIWCYPKSLAPEYSLTGKSIIYYDGYSVLLAEAHVGYECLYSSVEVNYLTDYNLTMPLAFDNELCIELYKKRHNTSDKCWVYNINDTVRSLNDNPLRAICEVLLMIAMDKLK